METATRQKPSPSDKGKRKAPPKFVHLPPVQAKKLKQQWVQKKKLQSAYFGKKKNEKSAVSGEEGEKEGFSSKGNDTLFVEEMLVGSSDEDDEADDEDERMEVEEEIQGDATKRSLSAATLEGDYSGGTSLTRESSWPEESGAKPRRKGVGRRARDFEMSAETPDRPYAGGSPQRVPSHGDGPEVGPSKMDKRQRRSRRGKDAAVETETTVNGYIGGSPLARVASHHEDPSLSRLEHKEKAKQDREKALARRALSKAAYSSSTLHTYKSDPLHKGKANGKVRSAQGSTRGAGKGQPDMKMRMNALLDKIKKSVGA